MKAGYLDDVRDFDRLRSLIRVSGTLVNLAPLRVGMGREPPLATVDNTFLRIRRGGKEIPYIPGSTIKGVLRNYFEQLARLKYPELHDPWDQDKIEKEAEEGDFCVVCGTFGSTKIASHIRVFDAYPTSKVTTNIKTCVGIDREFQAARPAILYTEEFIEPGYEWSFKMDIINIQFPGGGDERSLLLTETIRALKLRLISFGARKSVGFGQIQLKEAKWVKYVVEESVLKEEGSGNI
ncbi:MAG: CRISPR-associated protein Csm3 [Thaumarchaeota archaeon]|nr:CRISPR-associated protein Csm3 [Nitrososphaerota archaeon]